MCLISVQYLCSTCSYCHFYLRRLQLHKEQYSGISSINSSSISSNTSSCSTLTNIFCQVDVYSRSAYRNRAPKEHESTKERERGREREKKQSPHSWFICTLTLTLKRISNGVSHSNKRMKRQQKRQMILH